MQFQLLVDSEMRPFAKAYLGAQRDAKTTAQWERAHAALYRFTDPARDRYAHLQAEEPEEADDFRKALRDYVRTVCLPGASRSSTSRIRTRRPSFVP